MTAVILALVLGLVVGFILAMAWAGKTEGETIAKVLRSMELDGSVTFTDQAARDEAKRRATS